jgi:hypothetical protein
MTPEAFWSWQHVISDAESLAAPDALARGLRRLAADEEKQALLQLVAVRRQLLTQQDPRWGRGNTEPSRI